MSDNDYLTQYRCLFFMGIQFCTDTFKLCLKTLAFFGRTSSIHMTTSALQRINIQWIKREFNKINGPYKLG